MYKFDIGDLVKLHPVSVFYEKYKYSNIRRNLPIMDYEDYKYNIKERYGDILYNPAPIILKLKFTNCFYYKVEGHETLIPEDKLQLIKINKPTW
jgi:hypothetical protein